MKILLGLTGSVATILYEKLIQELQTIGDVHVILTESSKHFVSYEFLKGCKVFTDEDEWRWAINAVYHDADGNQIPAYKSKWQKNDRVLHIELVKDASVLVIAPCSANTMAKMVNGITDNLLTSVIRAWDMNRPVVVAPAMNTVMWNHPVTHEHITKLQKWGYHIIQPQRKMLACNTMGMGALANIEEIVSETKKSLEWQFPLHDAWDTKPKCPGIPVNGHQGAFLTKRKYHTHTGVDLYCEDGQFVNAVEPGVVVGIEDFTGNSQQTPWWNDTQCILIEGATGVICYGEVSPSQFISIGQSVLKNQYIGKVVRVLKEGKERPDIEGHSTSMLHMEIYKHGIYRAFEEVGDNKSNWNDLIDPTPFLMSSQNAPRRLLKA